MPEVPKGESQSNRAGQNNLRKFSRRKETKQKNLENILKSIPGNPDTKMAKSKNYSSKTNEV